MAANQLAVQSARALRKVQLAALAEAGTVLTKLEFNQQKAKNSPEGRIAARNPDMPTVEESFSNDIDRWTAYTRDARAGYLRNVAAQKEAQESLATSEAYLKAAITNIANKLKAG